MLELVEVSSFLTKQLNTYAKNVTPSYEFDIRAEVGKYENNSTVYGLLRSTKPILPPVAGVKNIKYSLGVKLQVVSPLVNFNLKNIENIIGEFVENWNGKEVEFSKGKGLLNLTLTATEGFRTESGQGNIVPIEFDVGINYTENVVTSGTKHWLLDGVEIPFLSEGIIVERNGKTSPINDRSYEQTFLTNQRKLYRFTFNYDTSNELCASLQRDLLDGELNKTYVLEYYDGYSYTKDNKYRTIVSILRNGNAYSQKPDTSVFDITFADVDDGMNQTKYYMALIDNPFDSQTENTRYFESQEEQIEYYKEKINIGADFDEIKAPNLNSLYLTNQIYINTRKYDVFDLINKNYAIIKVKRGNDENAEKNAIYFYYRVNHADIGLENQVSYELQLDSLQTLYFNDKLKIEGSFIQNAHLDRWIENSDGTISFNGQADSSLFERENLKNLAKRIISRTKLKYYASGLENYKIVNPKPSIDSIRNNYFIKDDYGYQLVQVTPNQEMYDNYDFYENDVALDLYYFPEVWVYVNLQGEYAGGESKQYNVLMKDYTTQATMKFPNMRFKDNVTLSHATLCFPLTRPLYYSENGVKGRISSTAFRDFCILNPEIFSYIYSIKISIKPPIPPQKLFQYTSTNFNGFKVFVTEQPDSLTPLMPGGAYHSIIRTGKMSDSNYGLLLLSEDFDEEIQLSAIKNGVREELFQNTFIKNELTGNVLKNKKFNPKLISEDYMSLNLSLAGDDFEMPLQKMNDNKPIFYYYEQLSADNTKALLKYHNFKTKNAIFTTASNNSNNGFAISNDFSIAFSVSAYSEYIANNKNAFLSFKTQQNYNREMQTLDNQQSIVSASQNIVSNLASQNYVGALSSAVSAGTNIAFNEVKFEKSQSLRETQFDFSIDNMRNAPGTLSGNNGNALLTTMINRYDNGFGIYAEIHEGLDHELEVANDIMFRDGYTYNRFGEVKDFDNIRVKFNYVRAILGNISGVPMSESARRDLRERFASGVRFWKSDNIDYTMENYENKLV